MGVWLVRAGKSGEREETALEKNVAVIGWPELPDLSGLASQEELLALCQKHYPEQKPRTLASWVGQLWTFLKKVQNDDLVCVPLKTRSAIAVGAVTGQDQYRPDLPEGANHTRQVKWLRTDLPRSAFDQDILFSLGAFMTVCRIQRNNAEARIRALIAGKAPPELAPERDEHEEATSDVVAPADLTEFAQDQIREHIERKFSGHGLADLVTHLLRAKGYTTHTAPEGPDGGVDVIAGSGPMGFASPRLCVQVKSGDSPVDVKILRELQGVMKNFGAEQALLVSWGGFKRTTIEEARRLFFELRLWDAGDVVREVLANYDSLPEDVKADLPLKRIWVLVLEE